MVTRLLALAFLAVLAAAGFGGFRLLEATLAVEVYQQRLAQLSSDHEALRDLFNQAVRRTAVTELRVEDGKLSVVIRTADGDLRLLPSPYDPAKEIYVDYVVVGGRLVQRVRPVGGGLAARARGGPGGGVGRRGL